MSIARLPSPRVSLIDRLRALWRGPGGGIGVFYLGGQGQFLGQSWDFTRVANSVYGNPTGYRCVEAIASNFSRPPWRLYPDKTDWPNIGEAKPLDNHPALDLLRKPNPSTSGTMWLRLTGRDLELTGKSFWVKGKDGSNPLSKVRQPNSLDRLPPQKVTVVGNQDHELLGFVYTDGRGRQSPVLPENMLYLRYPHPERVFDGMAPALVAGLPAETDTAATRFNRRLLDNDSALPGYLVLDGLSPTDFAEWKATWEEGESPGKTRFISGGQSKYFKVGMTNQELTYAELRQDSQDDIMRAFGVPKAVAFDVSKEALALDTPLPTTSGWTSAGDVQVGDILLDEAGRPTKVIGTTPIYFSRKCYELTFTGGVKVVADAGHRWLTYSTRDRRYKAGKRTWESKTLTTEQISRDRGKTHRIRVVEPLDLPQSELPLDPYVLGAWIGDGFSSWPTICGNQSDLQWIMSQVESRGYRLGELQFVPADSSYRQSFGVTRNQGEREPGLVSTVPRTEGAVRVLKELGVLQNKSIPLPYLRASKAQRLDLLQGLMDTDGCADTSGGCTFTTVKASLAWQVHELVTSLGMRASVVESRSVLGEKDYGPAYSVNFTPTCQVFSLPRKAERLVFRSQEGKNSSRVYYRTIVSVKEVESVPVRCIEVDSPSHLFLCSRAMIPTHNTYANAAAETAIFMQQNILAKWALVFDEMTLQLSPDYSTPFVVGLDLTGVDELQDSRDAVIERGVRMILVKAKTINEFRRDLGLPDVPWGNEPVEPFQQMSAVPMPPGPTMTPPPKPAPQLPEKTPPPPQEPGKKPPVQAPPAKKPASVLTASPEELSENGHRG